MAPKPLLHRKLFQYSDSPPSGSGGNKGKTILFTGGAALGGFLAVGLVVLFIFWILSVCKRVRKNSQRRDGRNTDQRTVAPAPDEDCASFSGAPAISMTVLRAATENFDKSRIIGDGGFGLVYRAVLQDGMVVAVKKLNLDALQGMREFQAEMETLSKVQHENLVRILGYCKSGPERLLIYSYVENGSLDEWLHSREDKIGSLDWKRRVKILYGVASGLSFLHHDNFPHIIHRDIKASNVLLDKEFQAKIIDFGLARFIDPHNSHVSTQVAGTQGYMPPEYAGGSIATKQGDVYSFGMLMVEVASGRRPNLKVSENGKMITLWSWAHTLIRSCRFLEILDLEVRESLGQCQNGQDVVPQFFEIALRCTALNSQERPEMKDVKSQLASLLLQV